MNTNRMELSINEMEQVNGGSKKRCDTDRVHRDHCGDSSIEAAVKAVGSAACMLGRVACNWFTGLFD